MTGTLVAANLKHRPMRSLLSVLLIAVPVTLILALAGLTEGMIQDARTRQRAVGADVIVRASTAASAISFTGAGLSEKLVPVLEEQPHVKMAMGVINHTIDLPLIMTGLDIQRFDRMNGGFRFISGGNFQGPDDVIVDDLYAQQHHLKVGDTLRLIGHNWRVSGIAQSGKLTRVAVPLSTLQDLDADHGKVTQIFVQADNPSNAGIIAAELTKLLPDDNVITMDELLAALNPNNIAGLKPFTVSIMVLGVIIGFLVIALSMYMSVLQRTREIGILKSLGASKAFILGTIEVEALVLAICGTILGILFSFGASWLTKTLVPASIQLIVVPNWWPTAAGITLLGAIFGALYPGFTAASHDPIEALAYE